MSNRPRRRLLHDLRLRAVVFAGLGVHLDHAKTGAEFRAKMRPLYRSLTDEPPRTCFACWATGKPERCRHNAPPFDPLVDYLDDIRPGDEDGAGWRELKGDFERAERIIGDARDHLPLSKARRWRFNWFEWTEQLRNDPLWTDPDEKDQARRYLDEANEYPARLHRAARALQTGALSIMQRGPDSNAGMGYPDSARCLWEVKRGNLADSEIYALLAILEARESAEKFKALNDEFRATENDAGRITWEQRRAKAAADLALARRLFELAKSSANAEQIEQKARAEKARADALECDPARVTGQKQRKGAKRGGATMQANAKLWHQHAERLAHEKWKENQALSTKRVAELIASEIPPDGEGWKPKPTAIRLYLGRQKANLKKPDKG